MNTIAEIAGAVKKLKSALIFTHRHPDGDTVGSGMALARALNLLGIETQLLNEGEIPARFDFLEGIEAFKRIPTIDAEGYISVDASDSAMLGELQKLFLKGAGKGKVTFNLDHHVSNTRYAKYNYVHECSSNCENVAQLIQALGVSGDKFIADYLLMGIVTDSGGFAYSSVKGDTLRIAAACVDAGADISRITYETYKKQSKNRAAMYAEVISRLRFFAEGKIAAALITADTLKRYGLTADATLGIVDFGLSIDEVEVSLCLMEVRPEQYRVSLRSKEKVNVNEVARTFGGGGHVFASGCMLFGPLEEVYEKLTFAISQVGNL